jgi:hypothetical protein
MSAGRGQSSCQSSESPSSLAVPRFQYCDRSFATRKRQKNTERHETPVIYGQYRRETDPVSSLLRKPKRHLTSAYTFYVSVSSNPATSKGSHATS